MNERQLGAVGEARDLSEALCFSRGVFFRDGRDFFAVFERYSIFCEAFNDFRDGRFFILERVRLGIDDDERFTRAFVRDKIAYNKWGRRKIEQALWAKGIDKATQTKILDEIDDSEYLSVLRPLLQAKQRTLRADSDYEARGKLVRYALQRGFTFDIISQCIDDAEDYEADDTNEEG